MSLHRIIIPAPFVLALLFLGLWYGNIRYKSYANDRRETRRIEDSTRVADSLAYAHKIAPKEKQILLQSGEGVYQLLEDCKIPLPLALRIVDKMSYEVEMGRLKKGAEFVAVFNPDSTKLIEFQYRPDRLQTHRILRDTLTDSLTYKNDERQPEVRYRLIQGRLKRESTLNQSLIDAGIPQEITQTVNNILLCKISFRTDARVKDKFTVLLQEKYYQDSLIPGRTEILYASYNGIRAGFHEAILFQDTLPKSTFNAHYTRKGEALIFTGLRYPVDRIHVSSEFGMRRHPVTGLRAMHNGIDYAGPTGSRIYAVAPGRVTISGYDPYSGNKIAIRHADGTETYYLHLSRRKVSVGSSVQSRQIIGAMGTTGRSTGPHLHFGVKTAAGNWVNPRSKRMIATPKLDGYRFTLLKKQTKEIDKIRADLTPTSES